MLGMVLNQKDYFKITHFGGEQFLDFREMKEKVILKMRW